MNKWIWIFAISGIALLISGGILLYLVLKDRKRKKNRENVWPSSKNVTGKTPRQLLVFYQKSYHQLIKVPIIKSQILKIRKRLTAINTYDEYSLRKETMRITYLTLGSILGGLIVLAIFSKSWMALFFGALAAIVINELFIDIFVNRVEDRLLKQFSNVLEDDRHYFQEVRMVDEALYQAAQSSPHDIKLQTERIHEVLTSKDPARELEKYYAVAPNRYLKVFSGVSHLIMEYGDRNVQKGSMYLNAINKFVQEIRYDLMRRQKLRYKLGGLTLLALIPILLSFPLQRWAENYFPITTEFYDSRIGFLIRMFIYAAAVICYILIRKLSENDEAKYVPKGPRKEWEKKAYSWSWVKWIVDRLVPPPNTRKHHRTNMLLKEANSHLTLEWLYIHRMVISVSAFVGVLLISVFLHYNSVHHIFSKPTTEETNILGYMNADELERANQMTAMDNRIMEDLQSNKDLTREQIVQSVETHSNEPLTDVAMNNTVNRIISKITVVNNEYLKWWELLIAIGFGVAGYYITIWMLQFQRRLRALEMQNEVDQFHVLISILCEFERISVETVLEWMERYSIIFRPALQKCLLNYDSGAEEALKMLKSDAPFDSFGRIVKRLMQAVEKLSLREAFDDLEMEQEYYAEQKKERLERLIRKKTSYGKLFGWTPGALLIALYLVFPFLYMSFKQLSDISTQLQTI
ncbi:hypothetical protein HUB98_12240 [Paenibacillus barcinonensis]|uniref:Uncharacterized protein n=1 Tax=Paenibacillus barcinonensis TaxID=198119 RepID=A0A2V4VE82_PAEBA|nr:hypothetical protein [Paenibacillus barcinonensis]PYE43210.1 hypothetical protein DFQ00_13018 [Paenibacillus barcinonensis]QKS57021.1 hypothetical protein HUB98_12240 [Paenibacillus barcinonensis]